MKNDALDRPRENNAGVLLLHQRNAPGQCQVYDAEGKTQDLERRQRHENILRHAKVTTQQTTTEKRNTFRIFCFRYSYWEAGRGTTADAPGNLCSENVGTTGRV